ncbi:UNVERIFIED_CONTAM: hypothetical protein Sradi_4145600 [Sesamum radiatum]|uniref:Uncharacterized protein n=1 Tax=Sesamum radiatum TaxID=300843 RepID=A0AAW2P2A2_SESRA
MGILLVGRNLLSLTSVWLWKMLLNPSLLPQQAMIFSLIQQTLDRVLGEVATDMKRGLPPTAEINSIAGDLPEEGVKEPQERSAPLAIVEGLPTVTVAIPTPSDKTAEKEGPACRDDKEEI